MSTSSAPLRHLWKLGAALWLATVCAWLMWGNGSTVGAFFGGASSAFFTTSIWLRARHARKQRRLSPVKEQSAPISLLDEATIRPMAASTLEKLIRHHRATCPGEDCDISLGLIIPTYERLIQRQITPDELKELFL